MTIEEALVAKLEAVLAAETAILGGRIYPDAAPQRVAAAQAFQTYIVYQHAGDEPLFYLSGGRCDLNIDNYGLEIWSRDRSHIETLRDIIYEAFSGANAAGIWVNGIWVQGATASDAMADAEEPINAGETPERVERLSLKLFWKRI